MVWHVTQAAVCGTVIYTKIDDGGCGELQHCALAYENVGWTFILLGPLNLQCVRFHSKQWSCTSDMARVLDGPTGDRGIDRDRKGQGLQRAQPHRADVTHLLKREGHLSVNVTTADRF